MKNIYFFLFIISSMVSGDLMAQDIRSDLLQLSKAYGQLNDLYMAVEIRQYTQTGAKEPTQTKKAEASIKGTDVYYRLDDFHFLQNSKCAVTVKEDSRLMVYTPFEHQPAAQEEAQALEELLEPKLDSLIDLCDSVIYLGIRQGSKCYQVHNARSAIKKMEMYINPKTFFLDKLVYYYQQANIKTKRAEIDYKTIDLKPQFRKDRFSETAFLSFSDGKPSGKGKYSSYRLYLNEQQEQ